MNIICAVTKSISYCKKLTLNHPVVMGRKTFESVGCIRIAIEQIIPAIDNPIGIVFGFTARNSSNGSNCSY